MKSEEVLALSYQEVEDEVKRRALRWEQNERGEWVERLGEGIAYVQDPMSLTTDDGDAIRALRAACLRLKLYPHILSDERGYWTVTFDGPMPRREDAIFHRVHPELWFPTIRLAICYALLFRVYGIESPEGETE